MSRVEMLRGSLRTMNILRELRMPRESTSWFKDANPSHHAVEDPEAEAEITIATVEVMEVTQEVVAMVTEEVTVMEVPLVVVEVEATLEELQGAGTQSHPEEIIGMRENKMEEILVVGLEEVLVGTRRINQVDSMTLKTLSVQNEREYTL